MAFREFKFHRGGGTLEYDTEQVVGLTYDDPHKTGALHKTTSPSITRLIRRGEWCYQCDLELPEPIHSETIQASVLRAIMEGAMRLDPIPWDIIGGRLRDQRCPACGALLTEKMIDAQMLPDIVVPEFDPGDLVMPVKPFKRKWGSG